MITVLTELAWETPGRVYRRIAALEICPVISVVTELDASKTRWTTPSVTLNENRRAFLTSLVVVVFSLSFTSTLYISGTPYQYHCFFPQPLTHCKSLATNHPLADSTSNSTLNDIVHVVVARRPRIVHSRGSQQT
ncbi:hypothetical protein SCHPADRAFT_170006 [Schizopora paradoxa]|uniref:Uncharacterized protein n=1 Tax=Schizopora paradoxa TaxID=27342 RepID=A0A0H2S6F6_9AGAM|nr:hypothetical protein SCHPADRAFT_170006 [Schizopora paradoxa]